VFSLIDCLCIDICVEFVMVVSLCGMCLGCSCVGFCCGCCVGVCGGVFVRLCVSVVVLWAGFLCVILLFHLRFVVVVIWEVLSMVCVLVLSWVSCGCGCRFV